MIAVDTNVLVRVIANDHPEQAKRAIQLLSRGEIFIAKTVLLELEWVLRHAYHIDREALISAFQKLLGLQNGKIEDFSTVREALRFYETGMDFADALHLASSAEAHEFATFDRDLLKRGTRCQTLPIVVP